MSLPSKAFWLRGQNTSFRTQKLVNFLAYRARSSGLEIVESKVGIHLPLPPWNSEYKIGEEGGNFGGNAELYGKASLVILIVMKAIRVSEHVDLQLIWQLIKNHDIERS